MILPKMRVELTNWSKSTCSPCFLYQASDVVEIAEALATARAEGLTVIPHGAGHSYTDAALNTRGLVIDVTSMRRILSWDPANGIMRVEPGLTMRDMARTAWKDGWWPSASPSTSDVTIGGCTAMNVNGKDAWKSGPFGSHVVSLEVLLASGETLTLEPAQDPQLFQAFIGSMGLLGILTSITVQMQPISSGYVTVRKRPGDSLAEILSMFAEEEPRSDFMEAWIDGFATGYQLGRGVLTCAELSDSGGAARPPFPKPDRSDQLGTSVASLAGHLGRSMLLPGAQITNRAIFGWGRISKARTERPIALGPFTYWPPMAFAGYQALLPGGAETFQAFVPRPDAKEIFERVLSYSQEQGCLPVWCILKQHRRDPFLLSYQVDGFSLELNYPRTNQTAGRLKQALLYMTAMVIEAGGRFYLAKDHFLTHAQYRRSTGDKAVDTFLSLKQCYDPETVLQSDLFRRVFMPPRD